MKKLALSLLFASAAVFGVGTAASAAYDTTTVPTTTVAPTTTDAGSGAGLPSTTVAPTVPPGGLPATGSSGIGSTTGIAIGLFLVGLGLFVVTRLRRGQPNAA
jgi:hypothetical protein